MNSKEKDRAWKFYKEAKEFAREHYCTKRELADPSERNVQKCMREIRATRNIMEPFKNIAHQLGEESNFERSRRTR